MLGIVLNQMSLPARVLCGLVLQCSTRAGGIADQGESCQLSCRREQSVPGNAAGVPEECGEGSRTAEKVRKSLYSRALRSIMQCPPVFNTELSCFREDEETKRHAETVEYHELVATLGRIMFPQVRQGASMFTEQNESLLLVSHEQEHAMASWGKTRAS